ncbi:MAG: hypothetical protein K6T99_12270 [Armatimonadetes bacterium]|nr:hypothetical protein [Armatimonadota bacterium]
MAGAVAERRTTVAPHERSEAGTSAMTTFTRNTIYRWCSAIVLRRRSIGRMGCLAWRVPFFILTIRHADKKIACLVW